MFRNPFSEGIPLPQCVFLAFIVVFAMTGTTGQVGLSAFVPFAFMWRPGMLKSDCSVTEDRERD
jgi:hypothetical protein